MTTLFAPDFPGPVPRHNNGRESINTADAGRKQGQKHGITLQHDWGKRVGRRTWQAAALLLGDKSARVR